MRFQSYLSLLTLPLITLALLLSIGCLHRPLVYNKNMKEAPTVDPNVYTVTEYNSDKAKYDAATTPATLNLDAAKLERNAIIWGLMTDVEVVYNANYRALFGGKNLIAVVGDGLTLGLGAAGTIATHAATKTIFAALNTGISGLNLSISKNYYAEQSFQIIGIAMQTRRDKIRAGIVAGLNQDVSAYPLNQAKRDLITYIQAGTLAAGLQELQEEAGVATATSKNASATVVPAAPPAPFVNVGILQNALTWSAVSGATSYTVYWGTSPGVTKSSTKLNSVATNDAVHPSLDSTTTYYYAISASNSVGESSLSSEVRGQPVATPTGDAVGLPAPPNLKVQMAGAAAVITFDAPTGAATFNVYKDATVAATTAHALSTGQATNLYIDTASDVSTHFYSVIAVDRSGHQGAQSAAVSPTATPTPAAPSNATIPQAVPFQLH